jgi:antitoxin HicB
MEYAALFEPAEEGGFVITIPDFGWGVSQGDTEVEARGMAVALLQTLVHEHIRKGEDLPRPSKPRGRKYRLIRLPALQGMKAELYAAFRASGMKKVEFARLLGIPKTTVDRLFDFGNRTRLDQIEAAFSALGKRLAIEIQDAAYRPAA